MPCPTPFSPFCDSRRRSQPRTRPRETYPKPSPDITVETFDQDIPNPRLSHSREASPESRPRHGWKTPTMGTASSPSPLRYTPLRDLRSVPLRFVGLLAKHQIPCHATRMRKGERPLPPYPPRRRARTSHFPDANAGKPSHDQGHATAGDTRTPNGLWARATTTHEPRRR